MFGSDVKEEKWMNVSAVFNNFPQLETKNLILRETKLTDAPDVFQVFTDDELTKYHDLETAFR